MAHKTLKSRRLGQHFLRSKSLATSLVRQSSLNEQDTVYEIGPGTGILTAALAHQARRVIANIPYNITSATVRKLLFQNRGLQTAYLIMQREAAFKFAGMHHETQFSILAKARFRLTLECNLSRADFDPPPKVDSLLLRISRRPQDAVRSYTQYQQFVMLGYRSGKRSLKLTFKPFFTYKQWRFLARELNFATNAKPSELSFEQWIGLFGKGSSRPLWANFLTWGSTGC